MGNCFVKGSFDYTNHLEIEKAFLFEILILASLGFLESTLRAFFEPDHSTVN